MCVTSAVTLQLVMLVTSATATSPRHATFVSENGAAAIIMRNGVQPIIAAAGTHKLRSTSIVIIIAEMLWPT